MGVIVAFVLMVVLVFLKFPLAFSSVIAAVVMCLLSGLPVIDTMYGTFMEGMVGFASSWFFLFVTCSIYASIMDSSGAAYSLGKWVATKVGYKYAIWGVSLAAFILTYGGISCFVIVFAMFPIALVVFREAGIKQTLIPAAIGAGAYLAPNTLIGSPAVCNLIPGEALGTTGMAAPMASVIVSLFMYLCANIYLILRSRSMKKRNIGFIENERIQKVISDNADRKTVHPLLALLPLVVIIVTLNILKWDVAIAVTCGIVTALVLFWKRIDKKMSVFSSGTSSGLLTVLSVASAVGLGSVAKVTDFYETVINGVTSMQGSPLISWAIAGAILSFMCSSGSGAQGILNNSLASTYLNMGCNPEILHRIASVTVLGPGNTPWNGTMCTTLEGCDCTHKDGYLDLLATTLISGVLGTALTVLLGVLFY